MSNHQICIRQWIFLQTRSVLFADKFKKTFGSRLINISVLSPSQEGKLRRNMELMKSPTQMLRTPQTHQNHEI
jgi:hypothetical protein